MPLLINGYAVEAMVVNHDVYLKIKGQPVSQARPRGTYMRAQNRLIMYDPTAAFKRALQILLRASLVEIGFDGSHPIFEGKKVKVDATYHASDNRKRPR